MSEVKRYDIDHYGYDSVSMKEADLGDWIDADDYIALQDRLTAAETKAANAEFKIKALDGLMETTAAMINEAKNKLANSEARVKELEAFLENAKQEGWMHKEMRQQLEQIKGSK